MMKHALSDLPLRSVPVRRLDAVAFWRVTLRSDLAVSMLVVTPPCHDQTGELTSAVSYSETAV